jgi:hypothetical protein
MVCFLASASFFRLMVWIFLRFNEVSTTSKDGMRILLGKILLGKTIVRLPGWDDLGPVFRREIALSEASASIRRREVLRSTTPTAHEHREISR